MIKVYIAKGPETGRFFSLKDKIALIGRGSDNSIRINEKSVSRTHVRVLREDDKYYIEDLKSRNGTWIDGHAFKWQGKALDVRVSIGLATVPESGIDSAYDLVNAADRALYEAKERGRDSIVSFSGSKKPPTS